MSDFVDIDLGSSPNDGTGDTLRAGGGIINTNNTLLPVGDKNLSTTQKIYGLSKSLLTGIADDTYFDLMRFNLAAGATYNDYGVITGDLKINVYGRNTSNQPINQCIIYRVSISVDIASELTSTLTVVGTDNMGSTTNITATLQEKAGATTSNLYLQFKITFAAFAAFNKIFATFNGQCISDSSLSQVVPSFSI